MSNPSTPNKPENTDLKSKAKAAATTASQELKSRANDVAGTVASEASSYADQAKGAAADEVKNVASALRSAANDMRSGSPQERTFSQIADGLADASDSVRDKDLGEIVSSLNNFAKRNPMVFLGSAALIGFAATRFAKASSDRTAGSNSQDYAGGYGADMDRPAPGARPNAAPTGGVRSPAISTTAKGDYR